MSDINFRKKYLNIIEKNKEEEIKTLQELVRIKSVAEENGGEYPFGEGVQKAFEYMLNLAENEGFLIKNIDNYGGHFDYGDGEEIFGLIGHLDVVPEGKDWDYGPYEAVISDGRIYGRGTKDDKGPVVAAFFAMKALKEAGFVPKKKIRMILGLDEETHWNGMKYYLDKVEAPDFGISPDGDFPVIHAEMGILIFDLARKLSGDKKGKGLYLSSLKGGNAPNMVPDHVRAVIRDENYDKVKEVINKYREETGYLIKYKGTGKSLEIVAEGISAHGARPEMGLNAVSVMMGLFSRLNFADENLNEFIEFYNKHIGFNYNGENIGMAFKDDISGKLIFNVGIVQADKDGIILTVNVRYPVTMKEEEAIYGGLIDIIKPYDVGLVKGEHKLPIFMPEDSPLVTELMDIYRKHSGDKDAKPIVIGGGTYARAVKNTVAYGPTFPHEEDCNHQKNEYISIESLMTTTKIYAEAIERLSGSEEKFYE